MRVPLPASLAGQAVPQIELLTVHQALEALALFAPTEARLVELRFFGGLTIPQIAEVMGISERSVARLWRQARAWLLNRISASPSHDA